MDSSVNTGDGLNSSLVFMSSDGYYASQALHSGLFGGAAMHNLTLPKSGREAIGREIMKERIREEILAREMVERKILEDEVRREIEMERIMEIRRWSEFSGTSGMLMHGDRHTQTFMPSWLEAGFAASLGRGVVQDSAEFAFRERSLPQLVPKKTMPVMAKSSLRHESEKFPPSKETTTSNTKASGAKRKAPDEPPTPAEKLWGCALCEITASSEEVLKEHLQGRKHKAKESLLNSKKKTGPPQSKPKNEAAPLDGAPGGGGPMPTKKKAAEGKKQQKFWCGLCRVKCNSVIMMEYHIAGKRHRNMMELKKANDGLKAEAAANKSEANEKVGEAENEKPVDAERAGFMKEECYG